MKRTLTLPNNVEAPRVKEAKEIAAASGCSEPEIVNWAMRLIEDRDVWANTRRNNPKREAA